MKSGIGGSVDYIGRVREFREDVFNRIAARDPDQLWRGSSLKDVRKVIVIAAASRSGSSLLFSVMRRMPGIYSLSGENTPFYKLNGLSFGIFPSDEIPRGTVIREESRLNLSRDLLSDFSSAGDESDIGASAEIQDTYIDDLALRFSLQWPAVSFSYEVFRGAARQAFRAYVKTRTPFSREGFYLELIRILREEHKVINPYYYDIPVPKVREKFPGLDIPAGPPCGDLAIEEPPFILLSPRKGLSRDELFDKTLLLKSSVDCYRMPFLETVFPGADIKIINLTRNPAASINGLYDGWLHRGFFSHNLAAALKGRDDALDIRGYSDRYEWGKWWWNYELPAGWQDYVHKRLEEVCAFQWYAANRALLDYFKNSRKKYCRVRHENITGSLPTRTGEIDRIVNFLGLESVATKDLGLDKLPVVQATEPPRPCRWKERREILLPLLEGPAISSMMEELDYHKEEIQGWS